MPINKNTIILLSGLFMVNIGFGITLPVLPFYIKKLTLAQGISAETIWLHVGLITGIFPFMQFLFSPSLGTLSDRIGRKPLILSGLAGYSLAMFFFSISNSLIILYIFRLLAGLFSGAFIIATSAYMADKTTVEKRGGGMSLLISVAGLGAVAGPLLGNLFAKANLKILIFTFDKFSFPFLISSVLSILASVVLFFILSEPSTNYFPEISPAKAIGKRNAFTFLKVVNKSFVIWLLFSFISEFSLAMFEGTFALHSQRLFEFNAKQMSLAFIVCGSVMGLLQLGPVPWLIKKKGEAALLPYGLMILGIGMTLLMASKKIEFILLFVAMVAMAMAILTPSLASLITKNSTQNYGTALGIFSSVNSLGQVLGVVTGSVMMIWFNHLPYFLVSIFLFVAAGLSLPALQNKILMRNKPLLETTGRK